MQVLEPVLVKTDQVVSGSGGVETEVDFNFAALEGALVLQSQFNGFTDNNLADIEVDTFVTAVLNYNPSFAPGSAGAAYLDDFTFSAWRQFFSAQSAVGLFGLPLLSPLYTHDSILIVRNCAFSVFASAGNPVVMSKIFYKRVIFDESELVPFVALRR